MNTFPRWEGCPTDGDSRNDTGLQAVKKTEAAAGSSGSGARNGRSGRRMPGRA